MRLILIRIIPIFSMFIGSIGFAQSNSNIFNHYENGKYVGQEIFIVTETNIEFNVESTLVMKPDHDAPHGGKMRLELSFDTAWKTIKSKINVDIGSTKESVEFQKSKDHEWQQIGPKQHTEKWTFGTDQLIISDLYFACTYQVLLNSVKFSNEPHTVNIFPIGHNEGMTFLLKLLGPRKGTFQGKNMNLNMYALVDKENSQMDKYELSVWQEMDTGKIMRIVNNNKPKPMRMDREGFQSTNH